MRPSTYLSLAALVGLTLAVPALVWQPYDDTALLAPRLQHLAALLAAVFMACLPLLDAARQAADARTRPIMGSILRSWFLGAGALASVALFTLTYDGMSYALYWCGMLALACVLAIMLVSSRQVAVQAEQRDDDGAVVRRRKQSARQDIQSLYESLRNGATSDRASIEALALLTEEIRFMPDHATGPDAATLFARLAVWRNAVTDCVRVDTESAPALTPALILEAKDLAHAMANWKR